MDTHHSNHHQFWIQAGYPRFSRVRDDSDESLDEALETIFPLWSESAMLAWHGVYIPLSYKYDISVMCSDILMMLEKIMTSVSAGMDIAWPSSTFAARWDIAWKDGEIDIRAEWHSVTGALEGLLENRTRILVPKDAFLAEWKAVLANVLRALQGAGYDAGQIPDMDRLVRVHGLLPRNGLLYE